MVTGSLEVARCGRRDVTRSEGLTPSSICERRLGEAVGMGRSCGSQLSSTHLPAQRARLPRLDLRSESPRGAALVKP